MMWHGKTLSVVLPTYNEKDSIRACINQFFATGVVDEVIVCNNNAADGTSTEVAATAAREVFEERQGYGWSLRKAMQEASGDLIVLCEPDGTFEPLDIFKLLAYAQDFDVVFGSRTNSQMIWTGANMGWFLKWGNWAVAKYMEFLFNSNSFTDVGCTMRLIGRPVLEAITPHFTIGDSYFGPEVMMLCLWSGARCIEIPVNYRERVGESMVTGDLYKALRLGTQMIGLITTFRVMTWFGMGPRTLRGVFNGQTRVNETHLKNMPPSSSE
ncbi:MAG: glycosyltransferase family 2 protein [Pleurocapsa minor GSE-CHR-MK-17-07R]|jgi:glycosyltransferase involved in cell wall biosynthesis|nr:glycosyltransferase family 2 protein [Pleurocapsa minor GSE-CHR-MK 17-07R]